MTDSINGFWVALERDTRVDDAEPLLAAVRQLKGVADVRANVVDSGSYIAAMQAQTELRSKVAAFLGDLFK